MGDIGVPTNIGQAVMVSPTDDIHVTFNEVRTKGLTVAKRCTAGPKPPFGCTMKLYYEIKTTAEHKDPVEIKIILPIALKTDNPPKLWRWYPDIESWKNITKRYNPEFHLIIGETDLLKSMFGVT